MIDPRDPTDPARLLAERDLGRVLLAKLYQAAADEPELLPNVELWATRSWWVTESRLPRRGTNGHTY